LAAVLRPVRLAHRHHTRLQEAANDGEQAFVARLQAWFRLAELATCSIMWRVEAFAKDFNLQHQRHG
jgi:hypothetical protein